MECIVSIFPSLDTIPVKAPAHHTTPCEPMCPRSLWSTSADQLCTRRYVFPAAMECIDVCKHFISSRQPGELSVVIRRMLCRCKFRTETIIFVCYFLVKKKYFLVNKLFLGKKNIFGKTLRPLRLVRRLYKGLQGSKHDLNFK